MTGVMEGVQKSSTIQSEVVFVISSPFSPSIVISLDLHTKMCSTDENEELTEAVPSKEQFDTESTPFITITPPLDVLLNTHSLNCADTPLNETDPEFH